MAAMGRTSLPALLLGAALLAGCPVQHYGCPYGADCVTAPVVTAVYAMEHPQRLLPDVALFLLSDPFSKTGVRVSPRSPASYTAFRIETEQALDGSSIEASHGGQPVLDFDLGLGNFTACVASSQVQLIDVDGSDGVPAGSVIPSSVCYDPSTVVGSNPHLTLVAGASDVPAQVFTCQAFAAARALAPDHAYAIRIGTGIVGANGKGLTTPAMPGWSIGTFTFRTYAGLQLLATGYIDPSTGYAYYLSKDSIGFLKDLDAEPDYRQPATADPLYLFFSEPLALSPGAAATVVRDDGSSFPVTTDATTYGDPRVLAVKPLVAWEPTVRYSLSLDPRLASAGGAPVSGSLPLQFTAGAGRPRVVGSTPADGGLQAPADAPIELRFQSPVDVDAAANGAFSLAQAGGAAVAFDVTAPEAATNFQLIRLVPHQRLLPGTRYAVSASGLRTNPVRPGELVGKAFEPFKASFTTAQFRLARLQAGTAPSNISSSLDQAPSLVASGQLTVVFNDGANGVAARTLHLERIAANGAATDLGAQIEQLSPTSFALRAAGPLAPGAHYRVRADQAITDPLGYPVTREGCAQGDCADELDFGVRSLGATLAVTDAAAGVLELRTALPADAASLGQRLPTPAAPTGGAVRLFRVGSDGGLAEVGVQCDAPPASFTSIRCQALRALDADAPYTAVAFFPPEAPLTAAGTLTDATGTYAVDQSAGRVVGTVTLAFTSACAQKP